MIKSQKDVGILLFGITLIIFIGSFAVGVLTIVWYGAFTFVFAQVEKHKKAFVYLSLAGSAVMAVEGYWITVQFLNTVDPIRYLAIQNYYMLSGTLLHGFSYGMEYLSIIMQKCSFLVVLSSIFFGMLLYSLKFHFFTSSHAKAMQNLAGNKSSQNKHLTESKITKKLAKEKEYEGTYLGVSKITGKDVILPDKALNQTVLVLGTTGAGKTITIRGIFERGVKADYPMIIIDGKPDEEENIPYLIDLANSADRKFYGFYCGNKINYNPFSRGNATELKDKIMTLKDEWESDFYKNRCANYLQTIIDCMLYAKIPVNLENLIKSLHSHKKLESKIKNTEYQERIEQFTDIKVHIHGLIDHLETLYYSDFGKMITDKNAVTLQKVIDENGIIYFALPALQYPEYASLVGKLIINDIKTVIEKNSKPIFCIFDEFSVFVGEQVLNLVNMGRGKGIHAVLGSQGISDFEKISSEFKEQVLNCINTLICHRLNSHENAECIANWIGTYEKPSYTVQIDSSIGSHRAGTVENTREYIIHPDTIKELDNGNVVYKSKVKGNKVIDTVRIKYRGKA